MLTYLGVMQVEGSVLRWVGVVQVEMGGCGDG